MSSPADKDNVIAMRAEEPSPAQEKPAPAKAQGKKIPGIEAPVKEFQGNLRDSTLFLNRELTWLTFNRRVLASGQDKKNAVLERIKFLAITGSNLDEFFMKRIGGLKQQVGAGVTDLTVDGRTPQQQIVECYEVIREIEREQRELLVELLELLKKNEIALISYEELSAAEQREVRAFYVKNIFPLVTPQAIDPAHPFPFISNLSLNLLVTLRYQNEGDLSVARVKVPVGAGIPRFITVGDRQRFVPLEDVMAHNLDLLFPKMEVESCELFRVTRNANTEREEEHADDLLAMIESEVRDRRFAPIVRVEILTGMDSFRKGRLVAELGLDEHSDVFEVEGMMAIHDLWEIVRLDAPHLKDPPHYSLDNPRLIEERSIFHLVRDGGPVLLQHPYESFGTSVERFLLEAARDPQVRAIKMTLYRTSADSAIIRHLVDAARNGKQVAVVVELKARFDEAANIRWANRLEEVGIHVTYGVVGLKTHCKTILVVRRDFNGLRRYAHIGTGNYHAGTAKLYTDLGMITDDADICSDLTELFNYLTTGYTPGRNYKKLLTAPKRLKKALISKIDREIAGHSEEKPGLIQFKMNALEDVDVTRALYRASQAGVKVDLIVRDSCRLRPGIPGLSESVSVVSLLGRFLEHSRIYYFQNGGDEEFFIGSADCMKRNLDSRVEVVCPVEEESAREEIRRLLDIQLTDNDLAWDMQQDGSYVKRTRASGDKRRNSHNLLIESADRRFKSATRLRKRKPKGINRRNLNQQS